MAVYCKFKSAKDYFPIPIMGEFISLWHLKQRICDLKGLGGDWDIAVSNVQTNEEYEEEAAMIPKNTYVSLRRLPGIPRKTVVIDREVLNAAGDKFDNNVLPSCTVATSDSSSISNQSEFLDFGEDLFSMNRKVSTAQDSTKNKGGDGSSIKPLVHTPAVYLNCKEQHSRITGCDRVMLQRKTPAGYICHRCNVPGHFIQHCPTNCVPNYVSSSISDVHPELRCSICKNVMKDAVLAGKCCFNSFCEKCIREYVIANSKCACGSTHLSVEKLIPNLTLRETIDRVMGSTTTSRSAEIPESTITDEKLKSHEISAGRPESTKMYRHASPDRSTNLRCSSGVSDESIYRRRKVSDGDAMKRNDEGQSKRLKGLRVLPPMLMRHHCTDRMY